MIKRAKKYFSLIRRIADLEDQLRVKEIEAQHLRAHLMELRVSNESPTRGAIGWMISAFVPDTAVKVLQERPELIGEYTRLVAEALVSAAVRELLRISKCGKVQALIFEPVTRPDQQVVRTRPWFQSDTDKAAALDYHTAKQLAGKPVEFRY